MEFTASMQLAIQFVLRHLFNPRSAWPSHYWANFTWFTKIRPGVVQKVRPANEDGIEVVERVITFLLGTSPVVEITMQGERRQRTSADPTPLTYWAVRRVRYQLHWKSGGDESQWVDRKLLVGSLTGLPDLVAPTG